MGDVYRQVSWLAAHALSSAFPSVPRLGPDSGIGEASLPPTVAGAAPAQERETIYRSAFPPGFPFHPAER